MLDEKTIQLEGSGTPNILLKNGEAVLMDISQGFRDLGLVGLILRHKGRLIVTNQRIIYFKKKTKDYEIEQMNMKHAGYVSMGYNLRFVQLIIGLILAFTAVTLFAQGQGASGVISLIFGLVLLFTARIQGLSVSGSGGKIIFFTQSTPARELSKIITIVSANS